MGFRKNRSCTDHIVTLRIIAEQSLEWNSSLYITFIDLEKAFDYVDHSTLWKILRHYADDLALLSHIQRHSQDNFHSLATTAEMAGLNINKSKTKTMRINSTNQALIKLDNEDIENVSSFTYLGSVIAVDGGTKMDVLVRIGKARTAFLLLRPVWRSKKISLQTKLRLKQS